MISIRFGGHVGSESSGVGCVRCVVGVDCKFGELVGCRVVEADCGGVCCVVGADCCVVSS